MMSERNVIITPQGNEWNVTNETKVVESILELNPYIAGYLFQEDETVNRRLVELKKVRRYETSVVNPQRVSPSELAECAIQINQKIEKVAALLELSYEKVCTQMLFTPNERLLELQKLFGLSPFWADERYLLPPASDFGVFSMLADQNFNVERTPMRFFENAKCYRREAVADNLSRFECFHLPDFHSLVGAALIEDEIDLMIRMNRMIIQNVPYFVALRITEDEYRKRFPFLVEMANTLNCPFVVNILDGTIRYWIGKWKFLYRDMYGTYIQLSTVQLDYKTPELFAMKNVKAVVHASPGSLERIAYVKKDYSLQKG